MLIWGSGGFRILGIVYTVKTLVLKLDYLFIFFERKLKNICSISSGFFVSQIREKLCKKVWVSILFPLGGDSKKLKADT